MDNVVSSKDYIAHPIIIYIFSPKPKIKQNNSKSDLPATVKWLTETAYSSYWDKFLLVLNFVNQDQPI